MERKAWKICFYGSCIALAAAVLLPTYLDSADFCAGEKGIVCLRDWLSTASGYIATAVAAVTIYFLYQQNNEAKRQANFALGDADPTVDAMDDLDDAEVVVIRIVNWNRRGVVLRGVDVIHPDKTAMLEIRELKIDERPWKTSDFESYGFPFLRGWVNRQQSPHIAQYKLSGYNDNPFFVWSGAEFYCNLQIIDETHRYLRLRATLYSEQDPNKLLGPNTLFFPKERDN